MYENYHYHEHRHLSNGKSKVSDNIPDIVKICLVGKGFSRCFNKKTGKVNPDCFQLDEFKNTLKICKHDAVKFNYDYMKPFKLNHGHIYPNML